MKMKWMSLAVLAMLAVAGPASADPSLKSALGLSVDQAKTVGEIENKYRRPYSAKRQERDSELRKLRRARIANDSKAIAQQEAVTAKLHEEFRQIYLARNDEIRRVLTADQKARFEKHLLAMKEMQGSSRDAKHF